MTTDDQQVNVITPLGFFSNTIEPVFNENIFSEENLSGEVQKPDLISPLVLRDNVMKAANDEDLSLTEFDAAANLARQTLTSDLTNQDVYTRSKRDLEFNINAERDIQFQQGRQLLSDVDAFIESQRATVVQREYEKELERQEELLKEEKKEQLQLMAMQMGIDPDGMSRKDLRSAIAGMNADAYSRATSGSGGSSRSRSGGSSGGSSSKCPTGFSKSITGECIPSSAVDAAYLFGAQYDELVSAGGYTTGSREDYIRSGLSSLPYTAKERGLGLESSSGAIIVPTVNQNDSTDNIVASPFTCMQKGMKYDDNIQKCI